MEKVLINSDVILNVLFDRQPFAQDSAKFLSLCEERKIEGFITAFTIANIYAELKKNSEFHKIAENLSLLLTFLDVLELPRKEIVETLHADFSDLESAIVSVTAENSYNITAIITENTAEFKNNRVKVLSPKEFLNQ